MKRPEFDRQWETRACITQQAFASTSITSVVEGSTHSLHQI